MFFACCCAAEPENSTSIAIKAVAATSEAEWDDHTTDAKVHHDEQAGLLYLPPQPSDEAQPEMFNVTIEKTSLKSPLGLHVDLLDEALLFVCTVLPGAPGQEATAVEVYNNGAPEGLLVQQGDYIQKVNGEGGSMAMREALKKGTRLELMIHRPILFQRPIECAKGESLGLDLNYGPNACSLLITQVKSDSVVARSAADVRTRDRIISVNGIKGNTEDLLKAIQTTANPVLGLSRPPSPP